MSKLEVVKKALHSDQKIFVAGTSGEGRFRDLAPGRFEVNIFVAPREALYKVDDLNFLLKSVGSSVYGLSRFDYRIEPFSNSSKVMYFGRLEYHDDVGREHIRTEVILTDESVFDANGFTHGVMYKDVVRVVTQTIWVRFYPTEKMAIDARCGDMNQCEISLAAMRKARKVSA